MTEIEAEGAPARRRFVATILVGSFLLFLVQPMIARIALPRLGGAPNVWNSAMLVYQALLLGGYAYAHALSRWPVRRQATVHLVLLALAALTLPVRLVALSPPRPGWEALWVPALFAASIGPVFLLVSAQAPLIQRWFAADPRAGDPYPLYAASNLGSFAGLVAYPLLLEPWLPLAAQRWLWSAGYVLLIALVAWTALARRGAGSATLEAHAAPAAGSEPIPGRRIALWLALAAVPSGLMLSTTTHLTTDVVAMPLLWVIPLGLYLLSFVVAFAGGRGVAHSVCRAAPLVVLLAGGMAMTSRSSGTLSVAIATVALLFVVAVALHTRLHALRPPPERLTLFYLVMSAGGALGGLFAALVAPLVFDWVWEHPLLVLAAALLLPQRPLLRWMRLPGLTRSMRALTIAALLVFAAFVAWRMSEADPATDGLVQLALMLVLAFVGVLVLGHRAAFAAVLLMIMLARGGIETLEGSFDGSRTRSYFGVYTVREHTDVQQRSLAHGTTMHGLQWTDPARRLEPTSYYGPTSGVGLALAAAPALAGEGARIGVVGFGTGTLACYRKPGQRWTFFEIDPAVIDLSRQGLFTFLSECAPDAEMQIGDARIKLADGPAGRYDVLAVDAFSSDAIPLHLMTREAFAVYMRALAPDGLLLVHISNRYIDLEPVVAAAAKANGWHAALRDDYPREADDPNLALSASYWVALAADPARLHELAAAAPASPWRVLEERGGVEPWGDDHASILPHVRWSNLIGNPL